MLGEVSETRIEKVFQEKEPFAYSFPYRSWDSMMPVFAFPLHWHEYYEILYVHSGELCATVDGKVYEARGGDIIIVSGNVLHGFFPAGVRAHVRIFQFEAKIFGECESDWGGGGDGAAEMSIFTRKTLLSKTKDGEFYEKAAALIALMFSEYERKNAGYRLLIKSKLCELALLFFRELPETPPPTMQKSNTGMYVNERLECIMSFVFQNYDNPNITLADAADATFVSKFHFTRFFRKHIGQSFHSYLSMVRVSHAVENLLKTDMRITDIAYQCGFSSLKTFNRVFKTYAGKSPSEYRALR